MGKLIFLGIEGGKANHLPPPKSPLLRLLRGSFLPGEGVSRGETWGRGHHAARGCLRGAWGKSGLGRWAWVFF